MRRPPKHVPGVIAVVRDGSFAGVVAETEDAAQAAVGRLGKAATWTPGEALPDEANLRAWIKSQPVETTPINTREEPVRPVRFAPCAASIRARSWRTHRWHRPVP